MAHDVSGEEVTVEKNTDPYNLHIKLVIGYFFVVIVLFFLFAFYCTPQVFLIYFGYSDSNSIKDTVISPFDSIVDEYSPKSSKPCVYSTLNYPYENTFPCNCE